MEISDIKLEMQLNGVSDEDIAEIVSVCAKSRYNEKTLDSELQKRGYEPIFAIDYDAFDDWEDSEYTSVERMRHKEQYK